MRWFWLAVAGAGLLILGVMLQLIDTVGPVVAAQVEEARAATTRTPSDGSSLADAGTEAPPTRTLRPTSVAPPTRASDTPTTAAEPTWTLMPTRTAAANESDCGALNTRLAPAEYAYVAFDPPLSNRVRAEPGISSQYLFSVQPGSIVYLINGPQCANGWPWWQVEAKDGRTGWTAEGDDAAYWLLPCPRPEDATCY